MHLTPKILLQVIKMVNEEESHDRIIKMRGLPWSATVDDIISFLGKYFHSDLCTHLLEIFITFN